MTNDGSELVDVALDDATQNLIEQLAGAGIKPLNESEPAEARTTGALVAAMIGPGPQLTRVQDEKVAAADGEDILLRVMLPTDAPRGVIVYFHGGGWVTGHIDEFDTLGRKIAVRTGCTVILVNYRKAPEYPYPTAVEDAWAAVRWTDSQRAALAGPGTPLIVAGDSAGGTLATIVARRARDAGGPRIDLQVLVYPVTDADFGTDSYLDPANQLLLNGDAMRWYWDHYAPPERRTEQDASPLRADNLAGLPPVIAVLAEQDVLRSEEDAYLRALEQAGVPVDAHVVPGQMHGFFTMANILPGHEIGLEHIGSRIDSFLARGRTR